MGKTVIRMGTVVSVTDPVGAGRIKVRLGNEVGKKIEEIPYAFPLAPKVFQSMPKEGEAVLVLCTQLGNEGSQRYYIGPIIAQPQFFDKAPYDNGRNASTSVIQGSTIQPLSSIDSFAQTTGAFPNKEDVAIIGRKSEDIILKDGELDIRCGVRKNADGTIEPSLKGPVLFNSKNPVYIQMKYKESGFPGRSDINGAINIVADKINLVSYKQADAAGNPGEFMTNTNGKKNSLLDDSDMRDMMAKLHTSTYGDVLIPILQKMCSAITNHVHPIGTKPPCEDEYIEAVNELDLYSIQSNNVKIS